MYIYLLLYNFLFDLNPTRIEVTHHISTMEWIWNLTSNFDLLVLLVEDFFYSHHWSVFLWIKCYDGKELFHRKIFRKKKSMSQFEWNEKEEEAAAAAVAVVDWKVSVVELKGVKNSYVWLDWKLNSSSILVVCRHLERHKLENKYEVATVDHCWVLTTTEVSSATEYRKKTLRPASHSTSQPTSHPVNLHWKETHCGSFQSFFLENKTENSHWAESDTQLRFVHKFHCFISFLNLYIKLNVWVHYCRTKK